MGDFVNTVVLRLSLASTEAGGLTFGGLLRRCADEVSNAAQHQTLPYQMLLKRLGHFDEEEGGVATLGESLGTRIAPI